MNLKTATLIAIIGISIQFVLSLFGLFCGSHLWGISVYIGQAFYTLSSIIFYGSIILFFAVFYSKQKD